MKAKSLGFLTVSLLLTGSLYAAQGAYVGAALGQSEFNFDYEVVVDGFSTDSKDTAWKIFGGFQVNENFAVEAAYTDLGAFTQSGYGWYAGFNSAIEASALEVSVLGIVPLNELFSVYGRLGLDRVSRDLDYSIDISDEHGGPVNESSSETGDDLGLTYGVGVSVNLGSQFLLRAEYQRFADVEVSGGDEPDEDSFDIDINMLNIAAVFKF